MASFSRFRRADDSVEGYTFGVTKSNLESRFAYSRGLFLHAARLCSTVNNLQFVFVLYLHVSTSEIFML